ncbi:MAG: hypothetical protein ABFD69_01900 [Candidatus Sumerlaeia bacterium]
MAVYELHYQTYEGPRRGAVSRWFAIARYAWMGLLGRRAMVQLFTLSWFQFVIRLTLLYLLVNKSMLALLESFGLGGLPKLITIDTFFFKTMIDWQLPFCFLFVFILGSGLISQDLSHNALVLFAAKPISRWEYILGKFATLFLLLMSLTWVQTALLFFIQWGISPAGSEWATNFWSNYAWLIIPITLYSVVISATLSLMILTFSSLTRNGRYAGVAFAATIIGLSIMAEVLHEEVGRMGVIQSSDWRAISPMAIGHEIGDWLFNMTPGAHSIRPGVAWMALAAIWAACATILKVRLNQSASKGA